MTKKGTKPSTQYDHHQVAGLTCTDESRTQQQYVAECDINNILQNYERTGILNTTTGRREPIYGDFSDERIGDFSKAMETINGIGELMQQLPAKVRSRFKNNPAEILSFVANPNNRQEAIELGIINAPPEPARVVPTEPTKP